jgi:hypothetical protein
MPERKTKRHFVKKKECSCGAYKYGFKKGSSKIYICYQCGKFDSSGIFRDEVVQAFVTEPEIFLYLMQTQFIKRIE